MNVVVRIMERKNVVVNVVIEGVNVVSKMGVRMVFLKNEEDINFFIKIISRYMRLDEVVLRILSKKLGENFFMLLNVLSGSNIKFLSNNELDKIVFYINNYDYISNNDIKLEDKIKFLSSISKYSENQVFKIINTYCDIKK